VEAFDAASTGATHFVGRIYSNLVRISQETHYVFATKPNRLILYRETVTVYRENHTEHKYSVGTMQSFNVLQQVVCTVIKCKCVYFMKWNCRMMVNYESGRM
jgi:hypothetical protein